MSTALLGFKIDSSQASSAAVDLEKLIAAAGKLDRAADSLEASTRGLNDALGKVGQGAQKAKTETESVGRSFQQQDDHVRSFRMELDRLTAKFQPMAAATKQYETAVGEINRAHQLGIINAQQMQKALEGERMAYERLKTSATTAGAAMAARGGMNAANQNVMGDNSYVYKNLAYQVNQIGQMGAVTGQWMNAVSVQLPDILASFGSLPLVLAGGATAIATSMLAASGALDGLFGSSSAVNKSLKEQDEIIASVADRWGDATPKVKEYADELERAASAKERQSAVEIVSQRELEPAVDIVQRLRSAWNALQVDMDGNRAAMLPMQQAISNLNKDLKDGTATTTDLFKAQKEVAEFAATSGAESVRAFAAEWQALVPAIQNYLDKAAEVRKEGIFHPGMFRTYRSYPGAEYNPDGQIQGESNPLPEIGPVPTRRPSDLEMRPGDISGGAMILNSDGKLVAVPTPTARPNYFEREADMPFLSGGRQGAQWDRAVLQEEFRRGEMKSLFTGFFTDFRSALEQNGGNLGKAFAQSFSNALMNEAGKLWDKLFSQVADGLVNAIMGGPSQGLLNKQAGFTGANTTLGSLLGAELAGGVPPAANSNVVSGAGSALGMVGNYRGAGVDARLTDILGTAAKQFPGYKVDAISGFRAGDPRFHGKGLATDVQLTDLASGKLLGNYQDASSFATYEKFAQTARSVQMAKYPELSDQFRWGGYFGGGKGKYGALDTMHFDLAGKGMAGGSWQGGLTSAQASLWPGVQSQGMGGAADAVNDLAKSAGKAADSVDVFGGGIGKIGSTLSSVQMSPLSGSAVGQYGGLWGGIGKLLGGISPTSPLWAPNTTLGHVIGAYASGTNYAPGGMAIVGEQGPELVNLPQGSQVFSNSRSRSMMANDNSGSMPQARPLTVVVQGASGDNHIRELARQGAQEAVYQDRIEQERGRFGKTQQTYNARKG